MPFFQPPAVISRTVRAVAAVLACVAAQAHATPTAAPPAAAASGGVVGPEALRARFDALHDSLERNAFGRPLVLDSTQNGDHLLGEVYASIDEPYPQIASALEGTDHWCSILLLHLNVKRCHADPQGLDMALGRKFDQPADQAYRLHFDYHLNKATPRYLEAGLSATEGPLGTFDYRIEVEAEPLDASRTILHMSYAYGVGLAARVATSAYLATAGSAKVGFSTSGREADGQPHYLGGVRGLIERNTMRYYLAIEAYAAAPAPGQLERRLNEWFDATERYARQLHEMDKPQYIAMKREEARQ